MMYNAELRRRAPPQNHQIEPNMSTPAKLEGTEGGAVASNSLLGYGLHMPLGSVKIVAIDDDDEKTWADVPVDSILFHMIAIKVRRSQYNALIEALQKHVA